MPRKGQGWMIGRPVTNTTPSPAGSVKLETFIPWTLVKRGVKQQVITPIEAPAAFRVEAVQERRKSEAAQDPPGERAFGLAHYWQHLLDTGRFGSLTEIAAAEGMDLGQVSRIARLAQLTPDIVEDCITDEESGLALENLNRRALPVDWSTQRLKLSSTRRAATNDLTHPPILDRSNPVILTAGPSLKPA